MKRKFTLSFLLFVIFLPLNFSAQNYSRANKEVETKIALPTTKESLKTLFANGNIQLDSIKSCKSQKTEPTDKTIFDYLSAIIANQSESKTKSHLTHKVELVKGKNNNRLWRVELTFNSTDEESGDPWNQGFRFLMRTQNHQMIRSSFECIGN